MGLGLCIGLCVGVTLAYPLGIVMGRFWRDSRRGVHEPADITVALKRGVR